MTTAIWEEVYRQNFAALVSYINRKVRDIEEARDLAQEVFCNAMRHSKPDSIENPRAYVFRAAHNAIINRHNKRRARSAHLHFSIQDSDLYRDDDANTFGEYRTSVIDPAPTAERIVLGREALAAVEQAIKDLPPRCRAVVLMKRYDGKSTKEIAVAMGVSAKTVENQLTIGLRKISEAVAEADR